MLPTATLALATLLPLSFGLDPEPEAPPATIPEVPASPAGRDSDGDGVDDRTERRQGSDPELHGLFPGAFPNIPEPMVFDLVRGLGARGGEFEFNTLLGSRITRDSRLGWAPEIEWAIVDGLAIEFELPMVDTEVEALKFAVQGTARESRPRFIHGWQVIGEYLLEDTAFEATPLYLAGLRLGRRASLFGMVGPRVRAESTGVGAELIFNPSVFVDVAEVLTMGLETNTVLHGPDESRATLLPQVHWQVFRHLRIQFGGGVDFAPGGPAPVIFSRVVIE